MTKPYYPNTRYEIRTNHNNGDEFYTLGSQKKLKDAKEHLEFARASNKDKKTIFKLVKAINISNGVILREDIKEKGGARDGKEKLLQ